MERKLHWYYYSTICFPETCKVEIKTGNHVSRSFEIRMKYTFFSIPARYLIAQTWCPASPAQLFKFMTLPVCIVVQYFGLYRTRVLPLGP
jgi:hypothetical protein